MASQTEIISVVFKIANPEQFEELKALRKGAKKVQIDVKANLDSNFERVFQLTQKKNKSTTISISTDSTNVLKELNKVYNRIREIQNLSNTTVKLGKTPESAERAITLKYVEALIRQTRSISPSNNAQITRELLARFGVQNFNVRGTVDPNQLPQIVRVLKESFGIDDNGETEAQAVKSYKSHQQGQTLIAAVAQAKKEKQAQRSGRKDDSLNQGVSRAIRQQEFETAKALQRLEIFQRSASFSPGLIEEHSLDQIGANLGSERARAARQQFLEGQQRQKYIDKKERDSVKQRLIDTRAKERNDAGRFRGSVKDRQALNEYLNKNIVGVDEKELSEDIALKYGGGASLARQLRRQPRETFRRQRLGGTAAKIELGFAGLFGGLSGLAGGAIGGSIGGAGGIFLGSAITQAVVHKAQEIFSSLAEKLKIAANAGLEFQRSIVAIAAVLGANTITRDAKTGQVLSPVEQLRANTKKATDIQLAARAQLLPIGISGEKEANLVRAVVAGASERGIILSAKGTATIAKRLGGTIQAINPQLLENSNQLIRDVEDLLAGSPQAGRTTLGVSIRPEVQKIRTATNEEELIVATKRLEEFYNAIRNSEQASVALQKITGALSNLATVSGDALLKTLTPGFNALAEAINNPQFQQALTQTAVGLGNLFALVIDFAAKISKNFTPAENARRDEEETEIGRLFGNTPAGFLNIKTILDRYRIRTPRQILEDSEQQNLIESLKKINDFKFGKRDNAEDTTETGPTSQRQALAAKLVLRKELGALRTQTVAQVGPDETVKQFDIQLSNANEEIKNLSAQLATFNSELSLAGDIEKERARLSLAVAEAQKKELEQKKRLAELDAQLNKIDAFTFAGEKKAISIRASQRIQSGGSPAVAQVQAGREYQAVAINQVNSAFAVTQAQIAYQRSLEDLDVNTRKYGLSIRELQISSSELAAAQKVRKFEGIVALGELRQEIERRGLVVPIASDTGSTGPFEIPTNDRGRDRASNSALLAKYKQALDQTDTNRVKTKNLAEYDAIREAIVATRRALADLSTSVKAASMAFVAARATLLNLQGKPEEARALLRANGYDVAEPEKPITSPLSGTAKDDPRFQNPPGYDPFARGSTSSYDPTRRSSSPNQTLIPTFAKGGIPKVNKPSIVGEEGPELFIPGVAGNVVPNQKSKSLLSLIMENSGLAYRDPAEAMASGNELAGRAGKALVDYIQTTHEDIHKDPMAMVMLGLPIPLARAKFARGLPNFNAAAKVFNSPLGSVRPGFSHAALVRQRLYSMMKGEPHSFRVAQNDPIIDNLFSAFNTAENIPHSVPDPKNPVFGKSISSGRRLNTQAAAFFDNTSADVIPSNRFIREQQAKLLRGLPKSTAALYKSTSPVLEGKAKSLLKSSYAEEIIRFLAARGHFAEDLKYINSGIDASGLETKLGTVLRVGGTDGPRPNHPMYTPSLPDSTLSFEGGSFGVDETPFAQNVGARKFFSPEALNRISRLFERRTNDATGSTRVDDNSGNFGFINNELSLFDPGFGVQQSIDRMRRGPFFVPKDAQNTIVGGKFTEDPSELEAKLVRRFISNDILKAAVPDKATTLESLKRLRRRGDLDHYADGGVTEVNNLSLLGEEGPELFVPKVPGTIINHKAVKTIQQLFAGYEKDKTPAFSKLLASYILEKPEAINKLFKNYRMGSFDNQNSLQSIGEDSARMLGTFKPYAAGGNVIPGLASLAGEYGKELFIPQNQSQKSRLMFSEALKRLIPELVNNRISARDLTKQFGQSRLSSNLFRMSQYTRNLDPNSKIGFPRFDQQLAKFGPQGQFGTIGASQVQGTIAGETGKAFKEMNGLLQQIVNQTNSQTQVRNYTTGGRNGIQQAFGAG